MSINNLLRLMLLTLLLSTSIVATTEPLDADPSATIREALDDSTIRDAVELWYGNLRDRAVVLSLYGPMPEWDVSKVTSLAGLFRGNTQLDEDLSQWNTLRVTDMSDTFSGCSNFVLLSLPWNTSSVTTMTRMFKSASMFSGDLSAFDMSSVTDISFMFHRATMFQGHGLDNWETGQVLYANDAFSRATNFNADISQWDTSNIISFQNTFRQAVSFNQDLSYWDVSSAMTFHNTFRGALNLQQILCWPTLVNTTKTTTTARNRIAMNNLLCDSPVQLDPCCVDASVLEETCCETNGCPFMITSTDHCNSTILPTTTPTLAPTSMVTTAPTLAPISMITTAPTPAPTSMVTTTPTLAPTSMDTTTLRPSPIPEVEVEFALNATSSPTVAPITSSPTVALEDNNNSTNATTKDDLPRNTDDWYGTPNDIPPEETILVHDMEGEEDADIHKEQPHYESASDMPGTAGTDAITEGTSSSSSSGASGNTQLTSQSNQKTAEEESNNQNNVWILTGSILGGFLLVVIIILTISWMRQGQEGYTGDQTTRFSDEITNDRNLMMSTSQSDMMVPLEGREAEMPVDW